MPAHRLPGIELPLSAIACGCMGYGVRWTDEPLTENAQRDAEAAVAAAVEAGINTFDHADIYARGKSEETFARILRRQPALRQQIVIQSKCGIRFADDPPGAPGRYDFSREHIVRSVDGSLQRLGTDYLDLLLLHRPDPLAVPEEVAAAFDELHAAGKVRGFGVSNQTAPQMSLLGKYLRQPLLVNQVQLSLWQPRLIDAEITGSQGAADAAAVAGTIAYCREHGILIQAWGPLAGGRLMTGKTRQDEDGQQLVALQELMAEMAARHGSSPTAIALAWLLRHPAGIQPIIGSKRAERIREAAAATAVVLSREDWYRLFIAGRGQGLP